MFTTVTEAPKGDFLNMEDAVNKLAIVRPLRYQDEGFVTEFKPDGTDVVFCDIAILDDVDENGKPGKIFRGCPVLQGWLKGTFKRYVGHTLVGAVYLGPRQKGQKPPYMWMDGSADAESVARAQEWVAANQSFLVEFAASVPEQMPKAAGVVAPAKSAAEVVAPAATTLAQLRAMSAGQNHHGAVQSQDPPF